MPSGIPVYYYIVIDSGGEAVRKFSLRLAYAKGVTMITNGRTLGHASRNKGFEQGSSEYVLFLDGDVVADGRLLEAYKRAIDENPTAC